MLSLPHLSKRNYILLGGSLLLAAGLALASSIALGRSDPVTLPDNTAIHVTLNQAVTSDQNRPGDHFEATVSEPIVVADKTIIPRGAPVEGLVVDAHHSGRLMGRARLQLALETVIVNGKSYDIRTSAHPKIGGKHKNRNLALIGGGAGGGGAGRGVFRPGTLVGGRRGGWGAGGGGGGGVTAAMYAAVVCAIRNANARS